MEPYTTTSDSLAPFLTSIAITLILSVIKSWICILALEVCSIAIKLNQLHERVTMDMGSPPSEIFEKEHTDNKEYLKSELKSLGVEPKERIN